MKRINQPLAGLIAAAAILTGVTLTGGAVAGSTQAAPVTGVVDTRTVVGNIIW